MTVAAHLEYDHALVLDPGITKRRVGKLTGWNQYGGFIVLGLQCRHGSTDDRWPKAQW
jgi:hypothetical protein